MEASENVAPTVRAESAPARYPSSTGARQAGSEAPQQFGLLGLTHNVH